MADTVAGLLRHHAADHERVFLVLDDGARVTYADQLDRSRRVAAALLTRGVGPRDRVMTGLSNCREFFDVWFATALVGAVLVPVNPESSADELDHIRGDAEPVLEIGDAREVAALLRGGPEVPFSGHGPRDVAAILYTSGTTSRAKGVMVTAANYVAVGRAVADHVRLTPEDRWLVVLPLFHANAQYYCTMSALVRGASLALAPRFSASRWGEQARTSGATLASLFAAPVRMILTKPDDPRDADNDVRLVLFAQNLTEQDARRFESRFGTRLVQLYGMTETVLPPTMNPVEGGRHDAIGRALPGVRIDLLDDAGQPASTDTGEMLIAGIPGETLASGYWRDPEATAEAFTAHGLRTGDLARRDADGFLYFVDRSKDMIKRSGENISAGEVERVAAGHPAVAECAAIGVPDPVRDEAILLVVVPRPGATPTEAEIVEWCRERLSPFKVPSAVAFRDALPRTSVGKIRKTELRTLLTPTRD